MQICDRCGKEYDPDYDEGEFMNDNWLLSYSNVQGNLCSDCATAAIEDKEDGIYFETCECCGKHFDLILEENVFDSNFPWFNGTSLRDYWQGGIICADCAIEKSKQEEELS